MGSENHIPKEILFCLTILLFTFLSSAQSAAISDTDDIWKNDVEGIANIDISTSCTGIDNFKVNSSTADLTSEFNSENGELTASIYEENLDSYYGAYDVSITCNGTKEYREDVFSINNLEINSFRKIGDSKNWRGERISLSADVTVSGPKNAGQFTYNIDLINNGERSNLANEETTMSDIDLNPRIPEDVSPGTSPIVLTVDYNPSNAQSVSESREIGINIQSPWSIEISNRTLGDRLVNYDKLNNFDRNVEIEYKGEAVNDLANSNFYLTVKTDNNTIVQGLNERKNDFLSSQLISYQEGKYKLGFRSVPRLDVGKYKFEIGVEDDETGKTIVDQFSVDKYISFSGTVIDSSGSAVNTNFGAVRDRTSPGITSSGGEYSANLLPGQYNMTVAFPELTLDLTNVRINKNTVNFKGDNQPIRYNELSSEQLIGTIQGATVLNAISVDFAIPYEKASAVMSYDSSKAAFDEVEVMQCREWVGSECSGEWQSTEGNNTKVDLGQVTFPVDSTDLQGRKIMRSAFMVIKNTKLVPKDLAITDDRVARGSPIPLSGKVETTNGNAVSDVKVKISILKGEEYIQNSTVTTASDGTFRAVTEVPKEIGTYNIEITGIKEPFRSFNVEDAGTFDVFVPRELSLTTPDSTEFYIGQQSEISFGVVNSGSAKVKDVKLRIKGLKNTWYEFQKQEWSSLNPGDRRQAVMQVNLPEDYCSDECKEYPKFDVEVIGKSGGQSLRTVKSIQAVVTKKNSSASGVSSSKSDDSSMFRSTGKFLERQSSLNIALGLILIFMMVLVAAVKQKKDDDGRSSRNAVSYSGSTGSQSRGNGGRPNVKKPEVSSSDPNPDENTSKEQEEKEDNDDEDAGLTCGKCGEGFDTKSALKIHEQAIH